MLSSEQITDIRRHLEDSKNPVFFFDNDPDGLCSFLLLQRFIERGKGIAIKSLPDLEKSYFKRVEELKADYIFVLDKPAINPEFIELAKKAGIPIVHIDHHNVQKSDIDFYYNTFHESGKNEPVSYLCYKIANKKEDEWIAAIGCITDSFLPDFIGDIKKQYPELLDYKYKSAFDILYRTRFGEISQIISFGLRDKTSNVVSMMRFLMKVKNPHEIIDENSHTRSFLKRFKEINEKYKRILAKAEGAYNGGEILYFSYSGDMSINQYIANELMYYHPHKIIFVVYATGNLANVSLRWDRDIRTPTVNALKHIEGATGGGHENSTGARMPKDKVDFFKEKLIEEIEKIKKN
jgi:single-stranded DNA-specific DHH superfamily exonuclease